jgi:hypothetical protein
LGQRWPQPSASNFAAQSGPATRWVTRLYYVSRRWWKAIRLFLMIARPGIVVIVADNDAGGIATTRRPEPSTNTT